MKLRQRLRTGKESREEEERDPVRSRGSSQEEDEGGQDADGERRASTLGMLSRGTIPKNHLPDGLPPAQEAEALWAILPSPPLLSNMSGSYCVAVS